MSTLEALHAHREQHRDGPAHALVYFFHAHIYFDASDAAEAEKMRLLKAELEAEFKNDEHCEVSALMGRPVGPHVLPNLEVLFTRVSFTRVVNLLVYALPDTFSALVHQLTKDQVGDHTKRAIWLGKQLPIKLDLLEKMDEKVAKDNRSDEEVIWAVHHPSTRGG